MDEEKRKKLELAEKVTKLYATQEFQDVILVDFVDDGIHRYCMQDNVDSEGVRDQLKARKIFSDYLLGIIEEAQVLKSEKEGE